MALAAFAAPSPARAAVLVTVDKSNQQMTVAVDGERRFTWPVSTGKTGYATPSGAWTAFRMEEDHYSKEWDDAPMPHSIFFTKDGHAIHGSFETKRLGMPASHGCVRLAPAHAATLFALVRREGLANTKVVLTGSEQVALARRKAGGDLAARAPRDVAPREPAPAKSRRDMSIPMPATPSRTTWVRFTPIPMTAGRAFCAAPARCAPLTRAACRRAMRSPTTRRQAMFTAAAAIPTAGNRRPARSPSR